MWEAKELRDKGYCVLRDCFPIAAVEACRQAFWPRLMDYLSVNRERPNRGDHRHFLPMPFDRPIFDPAFFFNPDVLEIVRLAMDDRVVADQWGCDVPVLGSTYQEPHIDYKRPLFAEAPDLALPTYMLVVSFGLTDIAREDGPLEIAGGAPAQFEPVTLRMGDVLIRHPWKLHRGSPNRSDRPRALVTIRYVRRWYTDDSREVNPIPKAVWESLTGEQRRLMRFPVAIL